MTAHCIKKTENTEDERDFLMANLRVDKNRNVPCLCRIWKGGFGGMGGGDTWSNLV